MKTFEITFGLLSLIFRAFIEGAQVRFEIDRVYEISPVLDEPGELTVANGRYTPQIEDSISAYLSELLPTPETHIQMIVWDPDERDCYKAEIQLKDDEFAVATDLLRDAETSHHVGDCHIEFSLLEPEEEVIDHHRTLLDCLSERYDNGNGEAYGTGHTSARASLQHSFVGAYENIGQFLDNEIGSIMCVQGIRF